MAFFDTLVALSQVLSPSGGERAAHETVKSLIGRPDGSYSADPLGSLIAHLPGDGPRLMLSAHLDTIGFIATYIEESGLIRFSPVGGLDLPTLLALPVRFTTGIRGVIGRDEKAADEKPKMEHYFIDIGARSREEAGRLVQVGDLAGFDGSPFVSGDSIFSPYLDNRVGVAVLIELLHALPACAYDLTCVFSAQEEVGLRGARAAAFTIDPAFALAVDVTDTGDNPDPKAKMAVTLGAGPAIKILDRSVICHPRMVAALDAAAGRENIPTQREVLEAGWTDAGAIHLSRGGVVTGGLSIPTRYVHSFYESCSLLDCERAVVVLSVFVQSDPPRE